MAQSGPGAQTSEFFLARLLVWGGIAMTAVSVCLPHLAVMFADLHTAFPDVSWVGKVGAAVATVASTVYTFQRYFLKARTIQADATVQIEAARAPLRSPP